MNFQFKTSAILLATTVVAIACGGVGAWGVLYRQHSLASTVPWGLILSINLAVLPLWVPILFAVYAIGRKALTVPMVITFAVVEAISIGITYWQILHN
jgi:hypothetical protein